jgi:hypothetical protein
VRDDASSATPEHLADDTATNARSGLGTLLLCKPGHS